MKTIGLNSKQFIRLAIKFGVYFNREEIKKMEKGTLLAIGKNTETGKEVAYVLNEIYIKKFKMNYSANNKIKSGGEMLISNFELPRGRVI